MKEQGWLDSDRTIQKGGETSDREKGQTDKAVGYGSDGPERRGHSGQANVPNRSSRSIEIEWLKSDECPDQKEGSIGRKGGPKDTGEVQMN